MDKDNYQEYKERFSKVKEPQTPNEWEEYNRLFPIIEKINEIEDLYDNLGQAKELLDSEDQEIQRLAREDIKKIEAEITSKKEEISDMTKQEAEASDPNNSRDAIIEIRAGAGGEEASLFAADLFRMYTQYAQKKGYQVNVLDRALSSTGGLKEITAEIDGKNAFGTFKYESGVHRVQRVPTTESSGRIHTSTASVAVLPEAQEVEIDIKPEDIRIEVFRASGAGGQCVNKTDSAVRITHIPTGIDVSCQESKSQTQNKKKAMQVLRARLYEKQQEELKEKRSDMRRDQIGSAMRSEKVRTYNFPQSRITDHRIKKSWHNLEEILDGNLDDIIETLRKDL
ncbi:peptide chain release factor 1 [Candidatus Dojkabacteria bacterium]|nr:peptide chain release factor 1 [Candidatus Dojkabacteria bacterium]